MDGSALQQTEPYGPMAVTRNRPTSAVSLWSDFPYLPSHVHPYLARLTGFRRIL